MAQDSRSSGGRSAEGDTVLEERVARLRELLVREPDDAMLWFGLGQALLQLDRPEEALGPLRRAIEIDAGYSAAHRDLGRALLAAGRAEEAREVLERAGDVAERTGDLQTAREVESFRRRAERAAGEEPAPARRPLRPRGPRERDSGSGEARALYREAFGHFANDRLDEAVAGFEAAIAADPEHALAWNGLSLALRNRGDLDGALAAALRLVELEPDDPLSHTNLSILYQNKGMIPEAEEAMARAMQLQSGPG